jgi:tetratricopeptide (TPR) repeat protein
MTSTSLDSLSQDALFQLALQALRGGDPAAAVVCLEQAVSRSDASGPACYLLGAQYAQIGRFDDAAREFGRAVAIDPALSIARFQYGLLVLTMGDAAQATQILAPLPQLGQANPLAHFATGLLHLVRDEFAEALACLERGSALNASNPPLNADMQKLMDRIRSTMAASLEPERAPGQGASHILLSAYTGNGL